jgi:hypothetical protein
MLGPDIGAADASIIDEYIQPPCTVHGIRDDIDPGRLVGDIMYSEDNVPANRCRRRFALITVNIGNNNTGPLGGKHLGDCPADASCTTRDDRYFVLYAPHITLPFLLSAVQNELPNCQ